VCDENEIPGCTNPIACNYDASTTVNADPSLCTYVDGVCESCVEGIVWDNDSDNDGICDADEVEGCQDENACNYNSLATDSDPQSCIYTDGLCETCAEDGTTVPNDIDNDGICDDVDNVSGCTNPIACNYDASTTVNADPSLCTYVDGVCESCVEGIVWDNDSDNDGVCDENEIPGCTEPIACNYNPEALEDDGSCDYTCCPGPGCCNDGTIWDEDTQTCLFDESFCGWQPDGNADGLIGVEDLLDLLAVYGDTDIDFDGVWDSIDDCLDLEACNYANDPTEVCNYIDVLGNCGGGCEGDSDNDGICDSEDDCVGVLDQCGVCNGPGPMEVVIESITILYDSVYAEAIDNWFVFEIGADTVFNYTCAPYFGDCGDLVSHDGYDYSTVLIGDQCWFSENCRYLPEVSPSSEGNTTDPYYYVYDYEGTDVEEAKSTANYETLGVLYNWPAVMTEGICPSGWHIPTDEEWQTMEMALGMSASEASSTGWRGSPVGDYMKSTSGWYSGSNGSNSSGYTGLPGGYRYSGGFFDAGDKGAWWSASESGSNSWERFLSNYGLDDVYRDVNPRYYGFSARCVRD
jgi:uncharacterized protein (TIGR02145 family)